MSIQNISPLPESEKLTISWLLTMDVKCISIEVAKDSEFTESFRHFLLPSSASQVSLDLGQGFWYFRVGGWLEKNSIDWSGIYGPITLLSTKPLVPIPKSTLRVNYTQSLTDGVRLHTNKIENGYYIIEYTTEPKFTASSKKTLFWHDSMSKGFADCMSLTPQFTYNIRITHLGESLPMDSVRCIPEWSIVKGQKSLPSAKRAHFQEAAGIKNAELAILKEASERPAKFISHADYTKYLAAKEKNSSANSRI
jgi:hypothetical protein